MRFEVAGIVGKTRRLGIAVVLVVGLAAQVGVARAEEGSVGSAAISPANDAIAFTYCQHSAGCSLAEYDLASGEARILEKPDSESWFRPVYSPSGDRIAFSRSLKGAWSTEIAMIARDGSVTSLTDRRGFTEASSFSPDGQTLLFVRGIDTPATGSRRRNPVSANDVYVVDLKSRTEQRLTNYSFYQMSKPHYLTDYVILFYGFGPRIPEKYSKSPEDFINYQKRTSKSLFYLVDTKTPPPEPQPATEFGEDVFSPSVAVDRRSIIFLKITNEMDGIKGTFNYDVFVMKDGVSRRLTKMHSRLSNPSISPDGSWVVFLSSAHGDKKTELWRMEIGDSNPLPSRIPIQRNMNIKRGFGR
jgi:Tol biopolymer transport system component